MGVYKVFESYEFRDAVNRILEISSMGNKYFQENKPWEGVKTDRDATQKVLTSCVNIVKNIAIMIKPIMPLFAAKIEAQLNVENLTWEDIDKNIENHTLGKAEIVLRKIDPIVIKEPEPEGAQREINFEIHKEAGGRGAQGS